MTLNERVRMLRKERGETQAQIAEAIGIGVRHYQRIEADDGLPGLEIFCALADHFEVSLDYLAGKSEERMTR